MTENNLSSFIWSVADLLRGDYKQSENGKVILPFTVLRRLDCVLDAVPAEKAKREREKVNPEPFLRRKSKVDFFNTPPLDISSLREVEVLFDANRATRAFFARVHGWHPNADPN